MTGRNKKSSGQPKCDLLGLPSGMHCKMPVTQGGGLQKLRIASILHSTKHLIHNRNQVIAEG